MEGNKILTYKTINPKSGHLFDLHGFPVGRKPFLEQHLYLVKGTS